MPARFVPCNSVCLRSERLFKNSLMLKAENHTTTAQEIAGVKVKITTYKIGESFYCHIDNLDPGAVIARAEGATVKEAEELALQKVRQRLGG